MSVAVDASLRQAKQIEREFGEFYDGVNWLLRWVPDSLADLVEPVVSGMNDLNRTISQFWVEVRPFLEHPGNPDKLVRHATVLLDDVATPLADIRGTIALQRLATSTEWTGSGAKAYRAVARTQGESLDDLRDLATELSHTLRELAKGIEDCWLAIGLALAALVVGIVTAAGEAVTIIGIVPGIATAASAVRVTRAAINAAVAELRNLRDTVDQSQDTISERIAALGDRWARATPRTQAKINDPDQWRPITNPGDGDLIYHPLPVLPPGPGGPPDLVQPLPVLPEPGPPDLVQPLPVLPEPSPPDLIQPLPVLPEPGPPGLVQPLPVLPAPEDPPVLVQPLPVLPEPGPPDLIQPLPVLPPEPPDLIPALPVDPPVRPAVQPDPATVPSGPNSMATPLESLIGTGSSAVPGDQSTLGGTNPSAVAPDVTRPGGLPQFAGGAVPDGRAGLPGVLGVPAPVAAQDGKDANSAAGKRSLPGATLSGPSGGASGVKGPGGLPLGAPGAAQGDGDKSRTNKWRVQGHLFDEDRRAARFTGVLGREAAKPTKKRPTKPNDTDGTR